MYNCASASRYCASASRYISEDSPRWLNIGDTIDSIPYGNLWRYKGAMRC